MPGRVISTISGAAAAPVDPGDRRDRCLFVMIHHRSVVSRNPSGEFHAYAGAGRQRRLRMREALAVEAVDHPVARDRDNRAGAILGEIVDARITEPVAGVVGVEAVAHQLHRAAGDGRGPQIPRGVFGEARNVGVGQAFGGRVAAEMRLDGIELVQAVDRADPDFPVGGLTQRVAPVARRSPGRVSQRTSPGCSGSRTGAVAPASSTSGRARWRPPAARSALGRSASCGAV